MLCVVCVSAVHGAAESAYAAWAGQELPQNHLHTLCVAEALFGGPLSCCCIQNSVQTCPFSPNSVDYYLAYSVGFSGVAMALKVDLLLQHDNRISPRHPPLWLNPLHSADYSLHAFAVPRLPYTASVPPVCSPPSHATGGGGLHA